ncbi:MAG: hypothetical protein U0L10_15660, partial [Lachnospiraceae bacterium]|nr:hypothetical protein [Lachnospiraceae bacterium]
MIGEEILEDGNLEDGPPLEYSEVGRSVFMQSVILFPLDKVGSVGSGMYSVTLPYLSSFSMERIIFKFSSFQPSSFQLSSFKFS